MLYNKIAKNIKYGILIILLIIIGLLWSAHSTPKTVSIVRSPVIDRPGQYFTAHKPLNATIYFNNIVGETKEIAHIKEIIDEAKHTIEIATFSFNSFRIKKALYDAHRRGVKITLILNKSTRLKNNKILSDLPWTIRRMDLGQHDAKNSKKTIYMHHKFILVDRGYPEQKLVTGSLNFTDLGEKYVQSFFIITTDASVISVYGNEFDLLNKKITGITKLKQKAYHPWAATIEYTDGFLEIWMSPGFLKNSVKYRILDLIHSAQQNIDIMMWDFTDRQIAQALIKKSIEGVKVCLIAEDTNAKMKHSIIPWLQEKKIRNNLSNFDIILDTKSKSLIKENVPPDFNPYLHQHTMIVDKKITVFGTTNWSMWGFYYNDEDMLITNNAALTNEFEKTFNFFYETLK